ncbi:unnamed protein product, partial [Amoebophrya sp. A25]
FNTSTYNYKLERALRKILNGTEIVDPKPKIEDVTRGGRFLVELLTQRCLSVLDYPMWNASMLFGGTCTSSTSSSSSTTAGPNAASFQATEELRI